MVTVSTSDDLDYILKLFGKWNRDQFPVTDKDDSSKILGAISRQEVIAIYNRESLKINLADGLTKELKTIKETTHSEVAVGYSIFEQTVPMQFIGKTLVDIKLRNKYGLEVLMIKQTKDFLVDDKKSAQEIITPDPGYKLRASDKLVLFGKDEKIEEFKKTAI